MGRWTSGTALDLRGAVYSYQQVNLLNEAQGRMARAWTCPDHRKTPLWATRFGWVCAHGHRCDFKVDRIPELEVAVQLRLDLSPPRTVPVGGTGDD